MRRKAEHAGNVGAVSGKSFDQPVDVESAVGEIAFEQVVEHRGLPCMILGQHVPIECVEEAFAALDVAGEVCGVSLGDSQGVLDLHGKPPSSSYQGRCSARYRPRCHLQLAAEASGEAAWLEQLAYRRVALWCFGTFRYGPVTHLPAFVQDTNLHRHRNLGS